MGKYLEAIRSKNSINLKDIKLNDLFIEVGLDIIGQQNASISVIVETSITKNRTGTIKLYIEDIVEGIRELLIWGYLNKRGESYIEIDGSWPECKINRKCKNLNEIEGTILSILSDPSTRDKLEKVGYKF